MRAINKLLKRKVYTHHSGENWFQFTWIRLKTPCVRRKMASLYHINDLNCGEPPKQMDRTREAERFALCLFSVAVYVDIFFRVSSQTPDVFQNALVFFLLLLFFIFFIVYLPLCCMGAIASHSKMGKEWSPHERTTEYGFRADCSLYIYIYSFFFFRLPWLCFMRNAMD